MRETDTVILTTNEIEALFLEWLRGVPVPLTLPDFQLVLAESKSKLPEEVCLLTNFPVGTTVGHAARSSVAVIIDDEKEYRLDNTIDFKSESESLLWWQNNRDNPQRITLERHDDGMYTLRVAPTSGPDRIEG